MADPVLIAVVVSCAHAASKLIGALAQQIILRACRDLVQVAASLPPAPRSTSRPAPAPGRYGPGRPPGGIASERACAADPRGMRLTVVAAGVDH